jgi:pimeloyl-ACP methyl ester carboxylesterase
LHGQRVTYLESGVDSGGPVVVLLHGLGGSSSTWLAVMTALGRRVHVLAPDLLGHRESAKPENGDYSRLRRAAGSARTVLDFVATTAPSHADLEDVRRRLPATPQPVAATVA